MKRFAPSTLPTFAASVFPAPPRRSLDLPAGTTVAITYGTYDLFHVGHIRLFERIKRRYDFLVVAVSTDEFNAVKGKKSAVPFDDRIELVRACRHVDLAIPETGWEQKERDIVHFGADAFVMGSDWDGKFDHLKSLTEVIYLPRTEGVSSSELKQNIRGRQ
jgi:glycerol-3-phosphate cytidylyltransferase